MKKSLLLGITWITLVTLTATTLYAQTVTGTSLVDKMKAAVHTFTLSADLNPGQTGFESSPVAGKKTGNMLTAGEWNRMLEIVANAGGGVSDAEVVTSQDVWAAAGTSYANRWSEANCPAWKKIISGGCAYPNTRNSFIHNAPKSDLSGWTCWGIAYNGDISPTSAEYPTRPTAYAVCGTYGDGGSSSSWSSTPWNPLFYYCTNAQSLDSTNVPCYGASRNQGLWDGRYRVVSCHIKGSTWHESINSQLLNFGRTGLATMQDKWNSLYTDSQWQLCIEWSVLVVDTQSSSSGSSSSSPSNLVYINPDNTNFAPLACTPGVNYMINPIAFSATSATAYTTQKVAVLSAGNWRVKGTGFLRNRNIDSGRNHILRASTVIGGTTTHIYTNSVDTGIYWSRFDETVSVPTGKTAEILIWVQNMSLYGGNIVAWCTN